MSTLIFDEFLQRLDWPAGSAQALLLTAMVLCSSSSRASRPAVGARV